MNRELCSICSDTRSAEAHTEPHIQVRFSEVCQMSKRRAETPLLICGMVHNDIRLSSGRYKIATFK
jgi:hypothetical protein